MKILFIGQIAAGQTSGMRMQILRDLGHEVVAVDSGVRWLEARRISRVLQQRFCRGPILDALNAEVLEVGKSFRPDLVWAEKQEYLRPSTFDSLKRSGARLLHYTPDPYFSVDWKRTGLMDDSMPLFDFLVTSKRYELADYEKLRAAVLYMPLGFSDSVHRPIVPASRREFDAYASDVSFIGGWDPRREMLLDEVSKVAGIDLKIWGYGWDHLSDGKMTLRRFLSMKRNAGREKYLIQKNARLAAKLRGNEIYGDEYAWAITSAKISLGFLRQVWPDQHTTRTFEIPACGSMLLGDRTEEHLAFFEEGVEAEFFEGETEMIEKIRFYLGNETARAQVARRGYERCYRDNYSYKSRMSGILEAIQ
jgi:spore maturation protein CgeB